MKKEIQRATAAVLVIGIMLIGLHYCSGTPVEAAGTEYDYIEQTESEEIIELTERVAEIYPICPEVLQAMAFYESSNERTVVSKYGDIGYMQVNPKWHSDRMDKLGVTDLYDGYSNILVGTDYLYEMCLKHGDIVTALMAYNMGSDKAEELDEAGVISDYARKILELSEQLERLHGK